MTTAVLVLILVGLAVWLSVARPSDPFPPDPADRDRERQLAELRAMAGSRADTGPR